MQLEIVTGTLQIFADQTCFTRLPDRFFTLFIHRPDFTVNVDITGCNSHCISCDQHPFDHGMGIVTKNVTILECTRLAFIGIANQVHLSGIIFWHETPFDCCRKTCPPATAQTGSPDFGNNPFTRHTFGKDTSELFVSSTRNVIRQCPVIACQPPEKQRFGMTAMQAGHCFSSSRSLSILSFVMRICIFLLFTIMTGPSPHAPMHSLATSVKRPSGVVSPNSIPSFCFR